MFETDRWDEKEFNWENKTFIKETIPTFLHMPFPPMIGKRITKMLTLAERAEATFSDKKEMLILFADPSPFKSEIYMSVSKEVPSANNVRLSGTFASKVFDGSYNAIPKFIKEMDSHLSKRNKKAKAYYIHYAYCPKCAKKYGKNYMILFAEI